jgi:hypothetical protein
MANLVSLFRGVDQYCLEGLAGIFLRGRSLEDFRTFIAKADTLCIYFDQSCVTNCKNLRFKPLFSEGSHLRI